MKNELFEPKVFRRRAVTVLVATEAPLKGFIFPVDFEGAVLETR